MSRVVKNVIVWVLVLAVILCIIAGFTFGLSSVSGVADAMEVTLPDDGIINPNHLSYGYYTDMGHPLKLGSSPLNKWFAYYSTIVTMNDGYVTYRRENSSLNVIFIGQDITSIIPGDEYTISFYGRLDPASTGLSIFIAYSNSEGTLISSTHIVPVISNDFALYSYTFTADSTFYTGGIVRIGFQLGGVTSGYLDICYIKLESGSDFTGFDIDSNGSYDDGYNDGYNEGYEAGVTDGTQSGYDEGYADGYDEGYNNGLADEVYTASQAFKSSAYRYMKKVENGVLSKYVYTLYENTEDKDIPLDGLFFAASDLAVFSDYGVPVPRDIHEIDTAGTSNIYEIVAKSQYALRFDSRLDQARWLVDNPMDNLVLFPTYEEMSGGAFPAYYVMNDRSLLERFVSGAGAAFDLGYQGGYNDGYDAGDGAGYNRGYGVGFNEGQADAASGNYTFLALIGSVLDAPISAFRGLLDFDLLGVNMSSFVLAIMSLCVIIVIIRVVLR